MPCSGIRLAFAFTFDRDLKVRGLFLSRNLGLQRRVLAGFLLNLKQALAHRTVCDILFKAKDLGLPVIIRFRGHIAPTEHVKRADWVVGVPLAEGLF